VEVLFIVLSYFLGSVPIGLLLTKAFSRQDPRQVGSGNIGATNVYRAAGKTLALLTLAGDALKGFIPVTLAIFWHFSESAIGLTGLAAFLGHLYPVFLRFKGGKGVAPALGIYLAICPWAVLIASLLFVGVVGLWRIVSLASMSAALFMPFLIWILAGSFSYLIMSICISILVILRHRANIRRLLRGQESRIGRRIQKDP
jgi:glycerol-3-phosphate acyltransferase PlsY